LFSLGDIRGTSSRKKGADRASEEKSAGRGFLQPLVRPKNRGGRIGHAAAAAGVGGRRFGGAGGAADARARDGAGVLAAGLRRSPQLLPRLQAMVPRFCRA